MNNNSFSSSPHRVFFFGGAVQSILIIAWWFFDLAGRYGPFYTPINCGHDLMTPQMMSALLEEIEKISELPHAN